MAITSSAKKMIRSSARKQVFNLRRKDTFKKTEKQFRKLLEAKKIEDAKKLFPLLQKAFDKAVKTGFIKKNNASRKKSRLAKALKKIY